MTPEELHIYRKWSYQEITAPEGSNIFLASVLLSE